jgi:hypothetical protein
MTPKPRNATFAIVVLPAKLNEYWLAFADAYLSIGHFRGSRVNLS